ncbi:MAG: hypothetical protein RL253_606, partial [Bacteroidota bacterium]
MLKGLGLFFFMAKELSGVSRFGYPIYAARAATSWT